MEKCPKMEFPAEDQFLFFLRTVWHEETNHKMDYIVAISFLQTSEACDSARNPAIWVFPAFGFRWGCTDYCSCLLKFMIVLDLIHI